MGEPSGTDPLFVAGVNLANDAATAELARALRAAGVHAVVLKGPATRQWLYGTAAPRLSMDVDLLLPWREVDQAEGVLRTLGCRYLGIDAVGPDRPHCRVWEHRPSGMMIELHRRIAGIGVEPEAAWRILSAETETMDVLGTTVEVLSAPARGLHLVLHAAQHGETFGQTRQDLAAALDRLPEQTWSDASRLAAALEAEPAFAAGLSLHPVGRALLERLGVRGEASAEVELRARSAPPMAEGIESLSRLPAWKKVLFVLRHVLPPPGYMRIWSPRARRGSFGLVLAYLWRPLWLAGHLVPALRAWRRARRAAEA